MVYLSDIYAGPASRACRAGTVKALRVFEPHYAYPRHGRAHRGRHRRPVGREAHPRHGAGRAGWLGHLHGPRQHAARTAAARCGWQRAPVDAQLVHRDAGRGGQLRGLPRNAGHREPQPHARTPRRPRARMSITPWQGPVRGFSFIRDVQPVLDRHCVSCHDGGRVRNPRCSPRKPSPHARVRGEEAGAAPKFTSSYLGLHPFVRRPGPESDYHLLNPLEYHSNTSELVQMLRKGHHGVTLDRRRMGPHHHLDRPQRAGPRHLEREPARSREFPRAPAGVAQALCQHRHRSGNDRRPAAAWNRFPNRPRRNRSAPVPALAGWPIDTATAANLQQDCARRAWHARPAIRSTSATESNSTSYSFRAARSSWARPRAMRTNRPPAWSNVIETVPDWQPARSPTASSPASGRIMTAALSATSTRTTPPAACRSIFREQPVLRVSWNEALEFCRWLSARTGKTFTLPDEARWEYACRAGTADSARTGARPTWTFPSSPTSRTSGSTT